MKSYYERIAKNIPQMNIITLIKCIAIAYIAIIDVFAGISITHLVDKYIFPKKFSEKDKEKSVPRLMLEVSLIISVLSIIAYIVRNIIQLIPFPLDDQYGFDYSRVKEVGSGAIFYGALVLYCTTYFRKVYIIKDKYLMM